MENASRLDQVSQVLSNLEDSFKTFQNKYEYRLKQAYSSAQRPFTETSHDSLAPSHEQKNFLNYISQGAENLSQKSLSTQEGSRGGYLIPHPMVEHIQTTLLESSPFRKLARVTHISNDSLELLLDKNCADIGWVSELDEPIETKTPELTKLRISTHQIYAKPRASQKLLDDSSIDLENWLTRKIADKMARAETMAFIQGDGEGKPRGFLTYFAKDHHCKDLGQIESFKTGADGEFSNSDVLLDALNAMEPEYLSEAVWLMSRSAMAAIRRLKDRSTGHYLWQPGLLSGQPHTLLGHPVIISDEMPALVNGKPSLSIAFGNFHEGYQIVDRGDIHVLRDPYSAKPYIEFYTTKRVGGDVINPRAIKVINFTKES